MSINDPRIDDNDGLGLAESTCYLNISRAENVDADDCPAGLLPSLVDAPYEAWTGWCKCGWWMPGPAFDPEDVANAWGDHLTPDQPKRILFASLDPS